MSLKFRLAGIFFCAAMLIAGTLSAVPMKVEHQIDILCQTAWDDTGWFITQAQDKDWNKWHYAVTDLNHDGNLEILKAKEGGLEGAPQLKCEELMEKKWTRRWGIYMVGGTDYPDIFSLPDKAAKPQLYINPEENLYFYIFEDQRMHGEYDSTIQKYAISINPDLMIEELAIKTWQLSGYDGTETVHYYTPGWLKIAAESNVPAPPPTEISEKAYNDIAKNRLNAVDSGYAYIGWMDTAKLWTLLQRGKAYNMLWDSYKIFTAN